MEVIACVDDKNGLMFNKRRQSRDYTVIDHILQDSRDRCLYMTEYSAQLFTADQSRIIVKPNFLECVGPGDYCFVEDSMLLPYESKIDRIIFYRWNRKYPADLYFDIPLTEHGWRLTEAIDFPGNSHEKITREVYCK
ncbi:ribonuclease Z [Oscillibacter sp.]|uniref:ribonuclease Z n=1 Tax=Oscillibacter sp. TaxID=1945593 RepID=UPI0033953A31